MKKLFCNAFAIATLSTQFICATAVNIWHDDGYPIIGIEDITNEIPEIESESQSMDSFWDFLPDAAQYKAADWSTCIGIAHNVTSFQAKEIANNNPEITFFFYVKGLCMVLENTNVNPNYVRIFHHGDAVFFTGNPDEVAVWGTASGLADGYVKQ